jgi:hypothetical protein
MELLLTNHKQTPTHEPMKHDAVKLSTKLTTSLNCKRYRTSGMLIHQQNPYASRSRRCTGRREAQCRELPNKV